MQTGFCPVLHIESRERTFASETGIRPLSVKLDQLCEPLVFLVVRAEPCSTLVLELIHQHLNLLVIALTRGSHVCLVLRVHCGHVVCDHVTDLLHHLN